MTWNQTDILNFKRYQRALLDKKRRFENMAKACGESWLEPWWLGTDQKSITDFYQTLKRRQGSRRRAILFLASVWDPWLEVLPYGAFDMHEAIFSWQRQPSFKRMFLAWARDPWWASHPNDIVNRVKDETNFPFDTAERHLPETWDRIMSAADAAKCRKLARLAEAMEVPFTCNWILEKDRPSAPVTGPIKARSSDFLALHFVLSLWNRQVFAPYGERIFRVHQALATWNHARRNIFVNWARNPWWC